MSRVAVTAVSVVLGLAACAAWAVGADAPFLAADADPMLAMRCRRLVAADLSLGGLALTVDVINGVALVGGPVPSADVGPKVEALLKGVAGLEAVKVACWVPATADPLIARVGDKLRAAAEPPARRGDGAAERPALDLPPLRLVPHAEPPPVVSAVAAPVAPPVATVTRYAAAAGLLGEPVADPADRLPGRLAEVRRLDARFAGLTAAAQGGVVRVAGRVRDAADTWDYVEAVRRLPGVTRVAVGSVVAE